MTAIDGLSLASKLLDFNNEMNVILISAYDDIKCNYEFLRKPISISTLINTVEKKMGNSFFLINKFEKY